MVIVGLGNPGLEYKKNRHNIGFRFIDQFAKRDNLTFRNSKFNAEICETRISNKNCLLVKPLTYMNASGYAVKQILRYFNIPIKNLLVVYDDISFNVGEFKIKKTGSYGGHKGIKSIIEFLQTQDIKRIKIGVGKDNCMDLKDWVTSDLSNSQLKDIDEMFLEVNDAVEEIIKNSIDSAMNMYNKKTEK